MKRIAVVMSGAVVLLAAGCAAAVVGTPLAAPVSPTTVELTAEPDVDEFGSAVSVEPAVDAPVSVDMEPVVADSGELLGEVSDSLRPVTTVQSVAINGGHTAAADSDALDRPATWGDLGSSDIADVWTYLEEQGLEPVAVTTTTTTAPVPVPTTTAPAPAPASASSPTPAPSPAPAPAPEPAREVRVQCPSGEVLILDYRPSMEEARELCGMNSSGSSGSSSGSNETYSTTITCADGSTHSFDRKLTQAEKDEVCAGLGPVPKPAPTTTTIPLPRLVDIEWLHADGSPAGGFCIIPPDETWRDRIPDRNWCPPPGPVWYRWTATYDNGETISGRTPELNPGDEWTNRPNDWNGLLTVAVNDSGATFSAGWD